MRITHKDISTKYHTRVAHMAETAIKAPLSIVKKLFEKRSTSDTSNGDFGVKAYFEEICGQSPPNTVRE